MMKTQPGYFSTETGVLLMKLEDDSLSPYVHADSLIEWLEKMGFSTISAGIKEDIIRTYEEYKDTL